MSWSRGQPIKGSLPDWWFGEGLTTLHCKKEKQLTANLDKMDRACSTHGRDGKRVQISVRKPVGGRPLGRLRRRWEDNSRINLREIEW
jgi:hypothetical protein